MYATLIGKFTNILVYIPRSSELCVLMHEKRKEKGSSSSTQFRKRQNDQKGRYTLAHFCESCKKVKNEVKGTSFFDKLL